MLSLTFDVRKRLSGFLVLGTSFRGEPPLPQHPRATVLSHVGGPLGARSVLTACLCSERDEYGGEDHAKERPVP